MAAVFGFIPSHIRLIEGTGIVVWYVGSVCVSAEIFLDLLAY